MQSIDALVNLPRLAWIKLANLNPYQAIFCAQFEQHYQLYQWNLLTGLYSQLTNEPAGCTHGAISADGQSAYYLHATQEGGIGHYVRIDLADPTQAQTLSRDIPAYLSDYIAECPSGRFLGFSIVNQNGYQVFALDNQSGGTPHLRYESEAISVGPILSYNGGTGVIASNREENQYAFELTAYDIASGNLIGKCTEDGVSIEPFAFGPQLNDWRFLAYYRSPDTCHPIIWNLETGHVDHLLSDQLPGDLQPWGWSPDGQSILACQELNARRRLYLFNLEQRLPQLINLPDGHLLEAHFLDATQLLVLIEDNLNPPYVLKVDLETQTYAPYFSLSPLQSGPKFRSVNIPLNDQLQLQGWLGLPAQLPAPCIIHLHGGPAATAYNDYQPGLQNWLEAGFVVLNLNYRGSSGFGAEFQDAILGQPGELEKQDLYLASRWLIDQGFVHPDQVMLEGASYGAYIALKTLLAYPDQFRAGLLSALILDWADLYQNVDEALQIYIETLFAGTPETNPAAFQQAQISLSPVLTDSAPALCLIESQHDRGATPYEKVAEFFSAFQAAGGHGELHQLSGSLREFEAQQITLSNHFIQHLLRD